MTSNSSYLLRIPTVRGPAMKAVRALLALAALAASPVSPADVWDAPPARPGDVTLTARAFQDSASISAREPVLVQLLLTNQSETAVRVASGSINHPTTTVTIQDAKDEVVAQSPRRERRGGLSGVHFLKPGQSHKRLWVVSGLYEFRRPGKYSLKFELRPSRKDQPLLAEDTVHITVLPFDVSRLERRCQEIFAPVSARCSGDEFPLQARTKALYSVNHDVVLPYLDWLACEWADTYACRAMRRIGTTRAHALLKALSARDDPVGEAARQSAELRLERSMWDVLP